MVAHEQNPHLIGSRNLCATTMNQEMSSSMNYQPCGTVKSDLMDQIDRKTMVIAAQIERLAVAECVVLSNLQNDDELGTVTIVRHLEHLATERRTLLSLRNSYQPVHRLLPELLVDLFQRYDVPWDKFFSKPWRRLRLVCRHWNELIAATPTLWRTIVISPKAMAWLELCLRNSREATVDVKFWLNYDANSAVQRLFPHAHRLRSLRLGHGHTGKQPISTLQYLFRTIDLPALEVLRCFLSNFDVGKIALKLSGQRCPRIRRLALGNVHLPSDTSILSGLRKLNLIGCTTDLTFDQFLTALASSPCLEDLHLLGFLDGLLLGRGSSSTASAPHRAPIVLAHLHVIRITHDSPSTILTLLHALHLPSDIYIVMAGGITSLLPPQPLRLTTLPVLTSTAITRASVDLFTNFAIRAGTTTGDTLPDLWFDLGCPLGSIVIDDLLPLACTNLVDIFRAAPIRNLTVRGRQDTLSTALWISVLTAFPLLENISTIGRQYAYSPSLWAALAWGLDDTPGAVTNVSMLCPHLSHVGHEHFVLASHAFYGDIIDTLRRRRTRGASLESLTLSTSTTMARQQGNIR
ncbi:hypothetical protein GY45DRAFT_447070 [Cubamyces sp. BRFM 1775]|nr:hypothetical protein GY45DRAFT_447070 [Cubamyces sp. BRFM 1775]